MRRNLFKLKSYVGVLKVWKICWKMLASVKFNRTNYNIFIFYCYFNNTTNVKFQIHEFSSFKFPSYCIFDSPEFQISNNILLYLFIASYMYICVCILLKKFQIFHFQASMLNKKNSPVSNRSCERSYSLVRRLKRDIKFIHAASTICHHKIALYSVAYLPDQNKI